MSTLLTWHRPTGSGSSWTATNTAGQTVCRAQRWRRNTGYWNTWKGTGLGLGYAETLGQLKDQAEKAYAAKVGA
jgi:hypothetical protein